jgi:HEAT repeat protein
MGRHLVWNDTRRAVRTAIAAISGAAEGAAGLETIASTLQALAREADEAPHAAVGALAELVNTGPFRERTIAAAFLRKLCSVYPRLVPATLSVQCKQALVAALRHETAGERLFGSVACMLSSPPTECVPALFDVMRGKEWPARYLAAAALSTLSDSDIEAALRGAGDPYEECCQDDVVSFLEEGASRGDPIGIRGICAAALAGVRIDSERVLSLVASVLDVGDASGRFAILGALKVSGLKSQRLTASVLKLAVAKEIEGPVRGSALQLVGGMAPGAPAIVKALIAGLHSTDPVVVRGAVEGLGSNVSPPAEAIDRYVSLTSSDSEELRTLAMQGLARVHSPPVAVAEALLARLPMETDREAQLALIAALGACGTVALPALIEIAGTGNVPSRYIAAMAVAAVGLEGARAVFEALKVHESSYLVEAFALVCGQLGRDGEALVPQLVEEFGTSINAEVLTACVVGIASSQTSNPDAVRVLGEAVLFAPEEVATYAERALRAIGRSAVGTLGDLLDPPGERTERLRRLIHELAGSGEANSLAVVTPRAASTLAPHLRRYADWGNDHPLITFVYVARIWQKHGPVSLFKISTLLMSPAARAVLPPGYAPALRTVHDHIKRVERVAGRSLMQRKEKRPAELIPDGLAVLQELEEYFKAKYGRALPELRWP